MANALNMELTDETVVLREDAMSPAYKALKWRLFAVRGGFGASSYTMGSALVGTFLADGETARMEGYMVERLATEDDLKALAETEEVQP